MWKIVMFGLAAGACACAQPTIGAIVNAASFAPAPKDSTSKPIGDTVIAQGSIFTIFGTGLGGAAASAPSLPLGTTLNGVSISVTSNGKTLAALPVFVSAGQLNAIVPSTTPIGEATVTVTFNGQTSAGAKVQVAKSSLGIFTNGLNGPAVAQIARSSTDVTLNQLTNPALPGQVMILYGTGLGAISGADNDKPGAVQVGNNVSATIGGKQASILYAGRSPDFPGLDQINIQLPGDVPAGCYTPAEVTATNQPSNTFVLPTAAAGSSFCVHPLGLGQAALARLDAGGTANIGVFQLLRAVVQGLSAEGAGGIFLKANALQVYQTFVHIPKAFGSIPYPTPLNGCVTYDNQDAGGAFTVPNFKNDIGGVELSAGPALQVAGSNGNSQGIIRATDATGAESGGYLAVVAGGGLLGAANWTLTGTGGPDVGPFTASITLPTNFDWTNSGNVVTSTGVPRSDITIIWQGGTSPADPVVYVFGNSTVINTADPSKNRGKSFSCAAPASAGKLTVPQSVIQQLPSSSNDPAEVSFGTLGATTGGSASFTAPLTSGTLDAGFIAYGEARTVSVKYQ
jgi:uncharacterized protein (TIGR03437 family)